MMAAIQAVAIARYMFRQTAEDATMLVNDKIIARMQAECSRLICAA